jgi:hypothetical protein
MIVNQVDAALMTEDLIAKSSLYVMEKMIYPIILGIPWLREVNPTIDW